MASDFYTWSEFKAAVLELMPLDKGRLGLKDKEEEDGAVIPGFNSLMIRQAVIDMQRLSPELRKGHETLYFPQDFATEGSASRGVLPPFAFVRDAALFNNESKTRHPLVDIEWGRRHEMTSGQLDILDNNGRICIEPDASKFYIYPKVEGQWVVTINWDATLDSGKSDFQDDELVPFGEDVVMAAAEFVKGKIRREVDMDRSAYETYFHPVTGSYSIARRNAVLAAKSRRSIRS